MKLYNEEEVKTIVRAACHDKNGLSYSEAMRRDEQMKILGIDDEGLWQIASERAEQLWKHGRTVEKDIEINTRHQLTHVVTSLLTVDYHREHNPDFNEDWYVKEYCPAEWDVDLYIKMLRKPFLDRVRISGALCAAEITRYITSGDTTTPYWTRYKPDRGYDVTESNDHSPDFE